MSNANNIFGLLADCQASNDAYAKSSAENWTPPFGDYNVLVESVDARTYVKNDATCGICSLNLQILDGDHAGKPFELALFQTNPAHGSVMKSLLTLMGGQPSTGKNPFASDAQSIGDLTTGKAFLLSRKEGKNRKDPANPYSNWKFVNELPTSAAA